MRGLGRVRRAPNAMPNARAVYFFLGFSSCSLILLLTHYLNTAGSKFNPSTSLTLFFREEATGKGSGHRAHPGGEVSGNEDGGVQLGQHASHGNVLGHGGGACVFRKYALSIKGRVG